MKRSLCLLALCLLLGACGRPAGDAPRTAVTPRPGFVSEAAETRDTDESAAALPAYAPLLAAAAEGSRAVLWDLGGDRTPELLLLSPEGKLTVFAWDGERAAAEAEAALGDSAEIYRAAGLRDLLIRDGSRCLRLGGDPLKLRVLDRDGERFLLDGAAVSSEDWYQAMAEFPMEPEERFEDETQPAAALAEGLA